MKELKLMKNGIKLIGREIYWEDACGRHSGTVRDINDSGNLLVDEEGKLTVLMSGEISVGRL